MSLIDEKLLLEAKSVSKWLRDELKRRKQVTPKYSLRRFSRHLGISQGTLSELLADRRQAGIGVARAIVKTLKLEGGAKERLLQMVLEEGLRSESSKPPKPPETERFEITFEAQLERGESSDRPRSLSQIEVAKQSLIDAVVALHPRQRILEAGFWCHLTVDESAKAALDV